MNCPVCQNTTIEGEATVCPQCQSELDAFHHIKNIDEKMKKMKKNTILLAIVLLIVLIGWLATYLYQDKVQVQSIPETTQIAENEEQNKIIEDLEYQNSQLKTTVEDLKKQLEELQFSPEQQEENPVENQETEKESTEEISQINNNIHIVKEGETLWEISEKYFGTGFKYSDIAAKNNIANPDLLYKGIKLRIKN